MAKAKKVNVDKRVESWLPIVQLQQQQQQQQHSRGPQIPDSQIQLKGSQLQQLLSSSLYCLDAGMLGCWDPVCSAMIQCYSTTGTTINVF